MRSSEVNVSRKSGPLSMRSLVSYDDISPHELRGQPAVQMQTAFSEVVHHHPERPPLKKKKKSKRRGLQNAPAHHWDDPSGSSTAVKYNASGSYEYDDTETGDGVCDGDEDSRELAHHEIWDDSALVEAWDAAAEEYEALNGPDKGWKNQPVHCSPLWYTKPKTSEVTSYSLARDEGDGPAQNELNSKPIDFASFVTTHDPSLSLPSPDQLPPQPPLHDGNYSKFPPTGSLPGADEAFHHALSAMYWGGYWTAVYHCQKGSAQPSTSAETGEDEEEEVEAEHEMENESGEFVSTQR